MSAEPVISLLPHVTDVIAGAGLCRDYSGIDPLVLRHAAERGTAVHKTIELFLKGTLDEDSIHEEVRPYYEAFRDWHAKEVKEVLAFELSILGDYAQGTLDLLYLGRDESITLVDYKTYSQVSKANYPSFRGQNGGYARLIRCTNLIDPEDFSLPDACVTLHLRKDGKWKEHEFSTDECVEVWDAALVIFNERLNSGLYQLKPRD